MRTRTTILLIPLTLTLAGCFNTNAFTEVHQGAVYEHVIVQYTMDLGAGFERSVEGGESIRQLTIGAGYVILDQYDGSGRLFPMTQVSVLRWQPNPDPPRNPRED